MQPAIKFILLTVCFFFAPLQAEEPPQEIDHSFARAATLLPTIVNGSVCAITGEFVDSQTEGSSEKPLETYQYSKAESTPGLHISRKDRPEQRFLETEYYKKGSNHVRGGNIELGAKDPRIDRVILQRAPVGPDSTPIVTQQYRGNCKTSKRR